MVEPWRQPVHDSNVKPVFTQKEKQALHKFCAHDHLDYKGLLADASPKECVALHRK